MNKGIILLGGAFNPVHTQHLEVLNLAKSFLENNNWDIIGGYFAVAPDGYVKNKLNNEAMKLEHRLKMINLSTENYEWMKNQKKWDFLNKHYGSSYELGKKIINQLDNKVKILLIVGADRIINKKGIPKWRKSLNNNTYITVCIGRDDLMDNIIKIWKEDLKNDLIQDINKWILINKSVNNISSTQIRKILNNIHQTNDKLEKEKMMNNMIDNGLLFYEVSKYILENENNLYININN